LLSCNPQSSKKNFDPKELESAWKKNNKKVISTWIRSLENKEISDADFFSRVAYLSTTTNFCFGNLEINDSSWKNKSPHIKKMIRENIALAYKSYLNSCLFFNKNITWDDTLPIQERFYKSDTLLTECEIDQLQNEIKKFCVIRQSLH
jgi:hypothetical protein